MYPLCWRTVMHACIIRSINSKCRISYGKKKAVLLYSACNFPGSCNCCIILALEIFLHGVLAGVFRRSSTSVLDSNPTQGTDVFPRLSYVCVLRHSDSPPGSFNVGKFLSSRATCGFSRRVQLHEVSYVVD